ncbi:MAG: murein biosynthesis integral membrane protein MurJ [Alphaproteobacteria bacterium]|nr:MAG: murein biosynthesis integral membrane protein MurJ [Alphaproteobacteria bacterium]
MAVLKNSVIVAFWTAASRGLGFARDLLIANKLGAGPASDAFFVALMLPNLLRRLFGEGAFNVAFVPILARHKARSREDALEFASATLSWLLPVVTLVSVLGMVFMPVLVTVLASGWVGQPEKFNLAVELGRITFPYLGLITLAAFLGAVCNTFGQFAAYAMVPALLNLSILACLFALPEGGVRAEVAAAWAIPLGGVAQAIYMWWSVRKIGLKLRLKWLPKHVDLRKVLLRMGPAAVGVGVLQLSIIIDNQAASFLGDSVISYLQYANRFYQLPMALIGIAVATVLLPHLSVLLGEGDKAGATKSFTNALAGCLALALGSCVGLFLLAPEMMQTLLQHGEMTADATQAIAWTMMGFVAGLPAYILTKVTAPAFFAAEDPVSPVKAGGVALVVNALLNTGFVLAWQAGYLQDKAFIGIAISTAIGGYVNAALQWYWLNQKGVMSVDRPALRKQVGKMLLVSGAMAATLIFAKLALPFNNDWLLPLRVLWLAVVMGVGGAVFVAGIQLTGLLNLVQVVKDMRNRRKMKVQGPATVDMRGDL